jgi:hypothetical protein
MSSVLLALAAFGLVPSTVFAGMVLVAVRRYLRKRRLALSIAVGRLVVCDPSWLGFGLWGASYLGSRILWRGRIFQLLPGGKMRAAE